MKLHRYAAIMSCPDDPRNGLLVHVDAISPGEAVAYCHDAVDEEGNVYEGYNFTLWPVPCN